MIGARVPTVVSINRPDVVTLIEAAANRLICGNKTEGVALAMRRLLDQESRAGSLFGAHPDSVRIRDGGDLTRPIPDDPTDAETGHEIHR